MKKLIAFMAIALFSMTSAFAAHTFDTTFNFSNSTFINNSVTLSVQSGFAAQYIELDEASGNIWIACGGTGNPDAAHIFTTAGVPAFAPVTQGLTSWGITTNLRQTSGIAIDRSVTPHMAYVVSDVGNYVNFISKFNAVTGVAANGIDSTLGNWTTFARVGDIQFDNAGRLFMVQKVSPTGGATCFVLDKTTGAALNSGNAIVVGGGAIKRGMGVSGDGNTVYLADESLDIVWKATGDASSINSTSNVTYSLATFVNYANTAANPSACEVDANGNVYISVTGVSASTTGFVRIEIYNAAGTLVETIAPTVPLVDGLPLMPRGVAFSSADAINNDLYVARFTTINPFDNVVLPAQFGSGPVAKFVNKSAVSNWSDYSF